MIATVRDSGRVERPARPIQFDLVEIFAISAQNSSTVIEASQCRSVRDACIYVRKALQKSTLRISLWPWTPRPHPAAAASPHPRRIATLPRVSWRWTPTRSGGQSGSASGSAARASSSSANDLTGIALGGNKTRNLEIPSRPHHGREADVVIVGLDLQSTRARQTVGACNRPGLETVLVLVGQKPNQGAGIS